MNSTTSLKVRATFAAVAAAVAMGVAPSAHAATFAAPVDLSFTLSQDILDLLGSSPVITTFGGASVSGKTITLPDASTTLSSAAATDLVSTAEASAYFSVAVTGSNGSTTTLTMKNFVYDNSAKALSATIIYNGAQAFAGQALTTTSATVSEAFNAATIDGLLTTGNMTLTTGAANGLMTAMGLSAFQQTLFRGTITSTNFGTLAIAAVPEPSTYALMGLGLVGVALAARKRKAA